MNAFDRTPIAAKLEALLGERGSNRALRLSDLETLVVEAILKVLAQRGGGTFTGPDFEEAVDDQVASLLVAGANISLTYNDAAGTLTIAAAGAGGVTDGNKGDITVAGGGTTWTVNSGAVTAAEIAGLSEAVDDRVAALLVAGVNITLTYDDTSNTLTIDATGGGLAETFETVNKNLDASDAALGYTGGDLTTVVYANGITKTLAYSGGNLTTVTLSGATPGGIDLVKTLSYTGSDLTGVAYS